MMDKIKCELVCHSNSHHLQQLYTGFRLLSDRGMIDLSVSLNRYNYTDKTKAPHLQNARLGLLKVIVNGKLKVYYDTRDGFEIDDGAMKDADYIFKRSYKRDYVESIACGDKVFPLGFNFLVLPDMIDITGLRRCLLHAKPALRVIYLLRSLKCDFVLNGTNHGGARCKDFLGYPSLASASKVLFLARAWNPADAKTEEKQEERNQVNEMRASCIRLLRSEYGETFLGGFARDAYTEKAYPDCIAESGKVTKKRNYIKIVKDYPICVATTGLHGSIGWKFGEYLAFSRAIVSEELGYEVPGDFEKGKNYLSFNSADSCVSEVAKLFDNKTLRNEMMLNNLRYYNNYVRADMLVLNSLSCIAHCC